MAFAMVTIRQPLSIGADHKTKYQNELREEARTWFQSEEMLDGYLYIRIIWFHRDRNPGDIDNIMKPIRDALQGVIYLNDNLIVKSVSERVRYTEGSYELIANDEYKGSAYKKLDVLLGGDHKPVIYIEGDTMQVAPTRQVFFGPVDGV